MALHAHKNPNTSRIRSETRNCRVALFEISYRIQNGQFRWKALREKRITDTLFLFLFSMWPLINFRNLHFYSRLVFRIIKVLPLRPCSFKYMTGMHAFVPASETTRLIIFHKNVVLLFSQSLVRLNLTIIKIKTVQ